jgi:formate hydrogenlyase subunit 3/multisubunit Na+/H+ antiporter MnhD subunit
VKISTGTGFPLATMFLGQFYTLLDLLHTNEMAGGSCHTVASLFNSSMLQTFLWEHAKGYRTDGKKPSKSR